MKILHCCLASFYIDNYGYQENIITRIHKNQGHDVRILASTETYIKGNVLGYINPSSYTNEDGIEVIRIPYSKCLPHKIATKIRIYQGVKQIIFDFRPDMIFLHDAQTAAVYPIIDYIKKNPGTKLYVDSHTDSVNSARGFVSKYILHGLIYKFYVCHTIPYTEKYYGTLPARVKFYTEVYGTPKEKTEYLPMGVDDSAIDFTKRELIRADVRKQLEFTQDDFVLITGGKLDRKKGIIDLLQAYNRFNNDSVKLLIFGSVQKDIEQEWIQLTKNNKNIKFIGWLSAKETYKYFFAADMACFPGTHSTLWEDAVGYGIPAIYRKWEGIEHMDRGGNCIILDSTTADNLYNVLYDLLNNRDKYNSLLYNARKSETMDFFAYSKIASKAIGMD